jgi:hypothetical protein
MKTLATIIFLTCAFSNFGQLSDSNNLAMNRGVIVVRKYVEFDTLITIITKLDSTRKARLYKGRENRLPKLYGFLNDNVLLSGSRMYVFNEALPSKLKKKYNRSDSKPFFAKIRRMQKRGALDYVKLKIPRKITDSIYREYSNDYRVYELKRKDSPVVMFLKEEKIQGTKKSETKIDAYLNVSILNDTISSGYFNTGNRNSTTDELKEKIHRKIVDTSNHKFLVSKLNCPKVINGVGYEFQFDLKQYTKNQVRIITSTGEEYICNYTIKGKKIEIENPPIAYSKRGKFNTK